VRDAVRAYWSLAESGEFGEVYNVCSGKAYSADEVIDMVSDIAKIELEIEQMDSKRRKADVPIQVGDYAKLHAATDWKPSLSLRDSLRDMLDFQPIE
jgi:GDP-4-dehydro-6-deoxy-D-mannose reductase